MAKPRWEWDAARQDYFYWAEAEGCWNYQNGSKVYPADSSVPRTESATLTSNQLGFDYSQQPIDPGSSPPTDPTYSLANDLSNISLAAYDPPQNQWYAQPQAQQAQLPPATTQGGFGRNDDLVQRNFDAPGPQVSYQDISQSALYQYNIYASKKFKGTPGAEEPLDPSFKIQKRGRKFFTVGKVFRVLWPELAGDGARDDMTLATVAYGERIFTKIRWFVVIVEGEYDCSCLPIQTYGGQGAAKPKLVKNHHAIIFTGSNPPEPTEYEKPDRRNPHERGMRSPIRVKQKLYFEKLDQMSRLNYKKIYTVEHNVKVREFGQVHEKYEEQLVSNFYEAWGFGPTPRTGAGDEENEDENDDSEPVDGNLEEEDDDESPPSYVVENDEQAEEETQQEVEAHRRRQRRASEHTRSSGKAKESSKHGRRR